LEYESTAEYRQTREEAKQVQDPGPAQLYWRGYAEGPQRTPEQGTAGQNDG